ncbi:MAG: hypothetical protein RLZZ200_92 [Pseudomonadota bacterium]|jgi:hypothetical protein
MLLDLARRIGRVRGYAAWQWTQARAQWQRRLRLLLGVGLAWVALTLVLAAVKLWRRL